MEINVRHLTALPGIQRVLSSLAALRSFANDLCHRYSHNRQYYESCIGRAASHAPENPSAKEGIHHAQSGTFPNAIQCMHSLLSTMDDERVREKGAFGPAALKQV